MDRSRPLLRAVAGILLVLHAAGCATWQPSPRSPREVLSAEDPGPVRITTTDGRVVVVDEPRVQDGSIVGLSERCRATRGAELRSECEMRLAIVASLDEVRSLEVRETDVTRTVVLVGVGGVALAWLAGVFFGFIAD